MIVSPILSHAQTAIPLVSVGDTWTWQYDTTKGAIPPTATFECSPTGAPPFTVIATLPSQPATYVYSPTASTWCLVRNVAGVSNIVSKIVAPPVPPTTDPALTALQATVAALTTRLAAAETSVTALQAASTSTNASIVANSAADVTLASKVTKAESKLNGVCVASKAMGGTATSYAGRMRLNIPCP